MMFDCEDLNGLAYALGQVEVMLEDGDWNALRERVPAIRRVIRELAAVDADSLDADTRVRRDFVELGYRRVLEGIFRADGFELVGRELTVNVN